MRSSAFFELVRAPHKTRRFWMYVALGIVPILCAELYMQLMGFRPPVRIQIQNGLITFAMWVATFWFGFRFGRTAWLVIAAHMFVFALFAWLQT
jgi:hypothetical protein